MRILIIGAGVIGSVYGGAFLKRGHEVVMLARGARRSELQHNGLVLEDVGSGQSAVLPVSVVDAVGIDDRYDLVMAAVRRDQMTGVVPLVAELPGRPDVLAFGNLTGLCDELHAALGKQLLFGFPAAGGIRDGAVVKYVLIRQQKTMLGEPDGPASSRVGRLSELLRHAGFSTMISKNPPAWLDAHTAFVVPIAYALYRFDTDSARLGADDSSLRQMIRATREAFRAMQGAGDAEIPTNLKWLYLRMPERFAVSYWRRVMSSPRGELWFGAHSRAAPEEMASLADELLKIVHQTKRPSPDLDDLLMRKR